MGGELGIDLLPLVVNSCWPDRAGLDKSPAVAARSQSVKLSAASKRTLDSSAAFGRARLDQQRSQIARLRYRARRRRDHTAPPDHHRSRSRGPVRTRRRTGGPVSQASTDEARSQGSLAAAVSGASLLVTCGPGGVGKTTTAAALGVAAARAGRRVVVVTVDPARRLAEALGLELDAAADDPHHVTGVGETGKGELWALMLDAALDVRPAGARAGVEPAAGRGPARQPRVPGDLRITVGRAGVHGDRAAPRTAHERRVGSRDRRHATVAARHRPARSTRPARRLPQSPGVPRPHDHASARSPR